MFPIARGSEGKWRPRGLAWKGRRQIDKLDLMETVFADIIHGAIYNKI